MKPRAFEVLLPLVVLVGTRVREVKGIMTLMPTLSHFKQQSVRMSGLTQKLQCLNKKLRLTHFGSFKHVKKLRDRYTGPSHRPPMAVTMVSVSWMTMGTM